MWTHPHYDNQGTYRLKRKNVPRSNRDIFKTVRDKIPAPLGPFQENEVNIYTKYVNLFGDVSNSSSNVGDGDSEFADQSKTLGWYKTNPLDVERSSNMSWYLRSEEELNAYQNEKELEEILLFKSTATKLDKYKGASEADLHRILFPLQVDERGPDFIPSRNVETITNGPAILNLDEAPAFCESFPQMVVVWSWNMMEEIQSIQRLLKSGKRFYVGIDTEFPGFIHEHVHDGTLEPILNYSKFKANVDLMHVIQLGVSIFNEDGSPVDINGFHTWQFNFNFDAVYENHSDSSLQFLVSSGLDLEAHRKYGIRWHEFSSLLIESGLVMNPNVTVLTFHGCYDFGYLIKFVRAHSMPKSVVDFIETMHVYFTYVFDVKYLALQAMSFSGGLQGLTVTLRVNRIGNCHSGGSDAYVTACCFFALIANHKVPAIRHMNGRLWGILSAYASIQDRILYYNPSSCVELDETFYLKSPMWTLPPEDEDTTNEMYKLPNVLNNNNALTAAPSNHLIIKGPDYDNEYPPISNKIIKLPEIDMGVWTAHKKGKAREEKNAVTDSTSNSNVVNHVEKVDNTKYFKHDEREILSKQPWSAIYLGIPSTENKIPEEEVEDDFDEIYEKFICDMAQASMNVYTKYVTKEIPSSELEDEDNELILLQRPASAPATASPSSHIPPQAHVYTPSRRPHARYRHARTYGHSYHNTYAYTQATAPRQRNRIWTQSASQEDKDLLKTQWRGWHRTTRGRYRR